MTTALLNADKLGTQLNCAVLLIDHLGKAADRGPRGSSAKHANADGLWLLSRNDKSIQLKIAKVKEGETVLLSTSGTT